MASEREARQRLISYDSWASNRDNIVREAFEAGVSKHEIFRLTGIARTTIDRILATSAEELAGVQCCASCDGSRCPEHCCDGFYDAKPESRYQVQP